jgi:protein-L-isoaspartate O-methyltransferase
VFGADSDETATWHRLLGDLYDAATIRYLDRLGVTAGWRCWEVGAGAGSIARWLANQVGPQGHVLATDIDTRHLVQMPDNVEVRQHDLRTDDLEANAYDLVYCRNVVPFLADPESLTHRLIGALKPGGWLLTVNSDTSVMSAVDKSHPLAKSFDTVMRRKTEVLGAAGVIDLQFVRSLPGLLERFGLSDIGNEGVVNIVRGGDAYAVMAGVASKSVDPLLLQHGAATAAEIADQQKAYADPTFDFLSAILLAVWGRRPTT